MISFDYGLSKMKLFFALVLIILIAPLTCLADQLAWNSRNVCEAAAKRIKPNSILISYCSVCPNDYVEVWLAKKVVVAATSEDDLFEVHVFGKRLYRSKEMVRVNQYSEPIEYEAITGGESDSWFLEGIDLAYVYVPTGKTLFSCLGKVLNKECETQVDIITLPGHIMEQIQKMEYKGGTVLPKGKQLE